MNQIGSKQTNQQFSMVIAPHVAERIDVAAMKCNGDMRHVLDDLVNEAFHEQASAWERTRSRVVVSAPDYDETGTACILTLNTSAKDLVGQWAVIAGKTTPDLITEIVDKRLSDEFLMPHEYHPNGVVSIAPIAPVTAG